MNYKIVSDTSYSVFMEKISNFFVFFISSRYFGSLPKTEKKLSNHCINFFFFYNTVQETERLAFQGCLTKIIPKKAFKTVNCRSLEHDTKFKNLTTIVIRAIA